jgi:serine/threonine-protein kinase
VYTADIGAPRVFQPGDVFRDHLVVEQFLGEGASGQVYAVRHKFTNGRFALKVMHLADRSHASKVARSLVEARAAYSLRHRNIVGVHDLACEADGMVWQLMELLEGWTLADLLDRYGAFSPIRAIDVAVEIAWGLQAAHENLVIHRDVKPSNVFLTLAGEIKILDFSLAKVHFMHLVTTAGRVMGTLAYMAPEHVMNAPATPQFDVFSLGTLLWELLAGRLPFPEVVTLAEEARRQIHDEPESLVTAAGLPGYVDDVVRRAMAKDPAQRFEGMWPMVQALRDVRARLLGDPAMAARLASPPDWERRIRIAQDPEGYQQYRPPRSLPRDSPAPALPSRRVVVGGAVVHMPVATTMPMPAVGDVAIAMPLSTGDPGAPTVQRRPARTRRWIRSLVLAAVVTGVLGLSIGLVTAYGLLPWSRSSAVASDPAAKGDPRPTPAAPRKP